MEKIEVEKTAGEASVEVEKEELLGRGRKSKFQYYTISILIILLEFFVMGVFLSYLEEGLRNIALPFDIVFCGLLLIGILFCSALVFVRFYNKTHRRHFANVRKSLLAVFFWMFLAVDICGMLLTLFVSYCRANVSDEVKCADYRILDVVDEKKDFWESTHEGKKAIYKNKLGMFTGERKSNIVEKEFKADRPMLVRGVNRKDSTDRPYFRLLFDETVHKEDVMKVRYHEGPFGFKLLDTVIYDNDVELPTTSCLHGENQAENEKRSH